MVADRTANQRLLALIGFGEAAAAFVEGWEIAPVRIGAYDIKTEDAATRDAMLDRYVRFAVIGCESMDGAVATADLVFSLVTADQAVVAAEAAAPHVACGALFVDGNSCSPQRKRAAADRIEAAGGRYVDMAIMAPVHPLRQRTPVLLSGPHAGAALERLEGLGMRPVIAGPEVGQASTIKMMRSIMVKGFEALTAECMLAARRAGVEDAVLASLQASDPEIDWSSKAAYYLERMMVHGVRRAAEMREVAQTVADLGLPDRLSAAIAAWQEEIGNLQIDGRQEAVGASAARILTAMAGEGS